MTFETAESATFQGSGRVRQELELGAIFRAILRRKVLLCVVPLLATALAAFLLLHVTRLYRAEALISIDPPTSLLQLGPTMPVQPVDMARLETEAEVIRSPDLAMRVVRDLKLADDPEFNRRLDDAAAAPQAATADWRAALTDARAAALDWLLRLRARLREMFGAPPPHLFASAEDAAVDTFLSRLSVHTKGRSYVIVVDFTSKDPEKAARIVNALCATYIADQETRKREAGERALAWLTKRLQGLHASLTEAEQSAEDYRRREGLTTGTRGSIPEQQLTELNAQLVTAETDFFRARARVQQLDQSRPATDRPDAAPDVVNSPTITALRAQEAQLITRLAQLSTIYGDSYPAVHDARAQLAGLRAKIKEEVGRIAQQFRIELGEARSRVDSIRTMKDRLLGETATQNEAQVRLRALEREVEARRQSYLNLLTHQEQLLAHDALERADGQVIAAASAPEAASYPKTTLILGGTFALTLLGTILFIVARELRTSLVLSREQIESASGLPVIGMLPRLRRAAPRSRVGRLFSRRQSDLLAEEAARTVHAAVALAPQRSGDGAPLISRRRAKVTLVASSLPAEGKSTLAAMTALQAARAGKRCLALDCDFRRRGLERLLGHSGSDGLLQVFGGEATLDEVLHHDEAGGFDFIASGASAEAYRRDAARRRRMKDELPFLLDQEMRKLLAHLEGRYDLIIIDAPPLMVVPDARILTQASDEVVFVIRWCKTREELVLSALRQLDGARAKNVGLVLTQIDMRRYAQYGFADSAVGSRLYRQYY